jgi:hypothetical protein
MLKTPDEIRRGNYRHILCCFCDKMFPDMSDVMCGCKGRGFRLINQRHRVIVNAVAKAIKEGTKGVVLAPAGCLAAPDTGP